MKKGMGLAVLAMALSGCASIFSGTTQEVEVKAAPGTRFVVTNAFGSQVASGESPGNVALRRGAGYFSPHAYKVKLSRLGYKSKTVDVVPGMNPWYFANILLGGFVGMVIVDPLTGAMFKLYPSDIDVELEPTGEDIDQLSREEAIIRASRDNPVSRHDYSAYRRATELQCESIGRPAVDGLNTSQEVISFSCRDGRTLVVRCNSGFGCK